MTNIYFQDYFRRRSERDDDPEQNPLDNQKHDNLLQIRILKARTKKKKKG